MLLDYDLWLSRPENSTHLKSRRECTYEVARSQIPFDRISENACSENTCYEKRIFRKNAFVPKNAFFVTKNAFVKKIVFVAKNVIFVRKNKCTDAVTGLRMSGHPRVSPEIFELRGRILVMKNRKNLPKVVFDKMCRVKHATMCAARC